MKYAPISMFVVGYWAHGNTGIFFNTVAETTHYNDVPNPLHPLVDFYNGLNQTHLLLICAAIYFMSTVVKEKVIEAYAKCRSLCGKKITAKDLMKDHDNLIDNNVRQRIGLFFESMEGDE
jgi:hypothetical protein